VVAAHWTVKVSVVVCAAVIVMPRGFSPWTAQLPAMPPSATECAPGASPSKVVVAFTPMATAPPPSTLTV
jgi:hypothetical protein